MRKVTMVRLGIATAITALGVSGAMASGCTSSSNTGGSDGGSDGSTSSSSGSSSGTSSGSSSSGSSSGTDSGPTTPPANLIVVHAAPGLGPFRFCFAQSTGSAAGSVEPFTALPDGPGQPAGYAIPPQPVPLADGGSVTVPPGTPGIYPGTIAGMPTFGTSVQNLTITPFIIDSSKITADLNLDGGVGVGPDGGAEETCTQLIGGHGTGPTDTPAGYLTPGVDYWQLPNIPAGTLKDGNTYMLSLTGCLPGFQLTSTEVDLAAESTAGKGPSVSVSPANVCGSDFDGGSNNLAITVNQLDNTTAVPGGADAGIGVQFANLSTALQGNPFLYPLESSGTLVEVIVHAPASGGLVPGFPGEAVSLEDGGTLEDGAAAPPIENISEDFNPIGAADNAPQATGALAAVVPVSGLPLFNSDGGTGPAAFGALTQPGSQADGGVILGSYPAFPTGVVADPISLGDLFAIPMADIYALSNWKASTVSPPAYFLPGQTYTFVVMGSNDVGIPQLVNPDGTPNTTTYDGRGLHIVAFPNTFTPTQVP